MPLHQQIPFIPAALICAVIAMATSVVMNPFIIKMAVTKHLTDNPNARKLQKKPVPVLGGMSVYLAFIMGLFCCNFFYPTDKLYVVVAALSVMFFIGFFDDMLDLSYRIKFVAQFGVIFMLWTFGYRIDTFVGLFGVTHIPMIWSCLLSLFAGVGLMNALNMIDGVDGLASGFGILTCFISSFYFVTHHDPLFALLSIVFVGALIPFFVCNVFSRKYKMFIGDSGSLIMGTLAYVITCRIIHTRHMDWNDQYCVSMMFAIYALPVFDTLRVMTVRMFHGKSPFKPDRTHLHHMFVDIGYPHVMITAILLIINCIIIGIWLLSAWYMSSINGQFFVVIASAVLLVQGLYFFLRRVSVKHPEVFDRFKKHSKKISRVPIRHRDQITELIDGKVKRRRKIQKIKNKQRTNEPYHRHGDHRGRGCE